MFKKSFRMLLVFCFMALGFQSIAFAGSSNIVNWNQTYTYEVMTQDIQELANTYPDLITYKSIGKTAYGRDIWAVKLGNGEATVFFNGSHHAREWLTTTLNMYMIDQYAQAYTNNGTISDYNVRDLLSKVTIWFVPMVNPDGVTLQEKGANAFPASVRSNLIKMNGGATDFSKWKANAQGVDPNRQYDADWEHITDVSGYPNWKNYKGTAPLEIPEAKSLVDFTYQIDPQIAVAYHSAGQILYWNFHNKPENLQRDKQMALNISDMTGYSLVKPTPNPSGGGYTDWFIQEFGRPGLTPEIGIKPGEDNLPVSAFPTIWQQNKAMGLYIANEGYQLWQQKVPVKKIDTQVTLVEPVNAIHDSPSNPTTYCYLSPQTVHAFEQQGNWFHIDTWLGDKWIYSKYAIVGGSEQTSEYVSLDKTTEIRNLPNIDASYVMGSVSPQKVHAVEKWNNWYKIETWMGEQWIQV
jgi:g-D-glutamyl-meso-diaminopimelate peptidase